MSNSNFYTKGVREDVISRINQVHTMTMFCPLCDYGVMALMNSFELMLPQYKSETDGNVWLGVPAIDAVNAFLFTNNFCKDSAGKFIDINMDIIGVIASSLKMFPRLKLINFEFTPDSEVFEIYNQLLKQKKVEKKKYIYRVDKLEIHLADLFSQDVIDIVNKVFMYNGLIPNSYLHRKFQLDFDYDDYTSFMDMFINNNRDNLNMLDMNVCDYFRKFPPLIEDQKPKISLITNYSEEFGA